VTRVPFSPSREFNASALSQPARVVFAAMLTMQLVARGLIERRYVEKAPENATGKQRGRSVNIVEMLSDETARGETTYIHFVPEDSRSFSNFLASTDDKYVRGNLLSDVTPRDTLSHFCRE